MLCWCKPPFLFVQVGWLSEAKGMVKRSSAIDLAGLTNVGLAVSATERRLNL